MSQSWWYDEIMPTKPAKPQKASFDTIATRELWGSVSRQDADGLRRAIARKGNPNDQKALNPWSPPSTPLLDAVDSGFVDGIKILAKVGARRRASGKKGISAFAKAVLAGSESSFEELERQFGALTQSEILECFVSLGSLPRSKDGHVAFDLWSGKIIDTLVKNKTRLSTPTAVSVAMRLLGGEGMLAPVYPGLVEEMISAGVMPPHALKEATHMQGLAEWSSQLAKRQWSNEEQAALDLVRSMGFPFAQAALACQDDTETTFLREQNSIMEQQALDLLSPTPAHSRRSRSRL